MKKNIIFLPILFLFLSCQNMIYTKVETENITSKTSMQPFDHLNNPMVVCYSYCVTKGLFGNEKLFTQDEIIGDIFIVYDWENEEVFDWAFTPKLKGWSNDRGAELGTPKKYFSSAFYSEKIVELNPETGQFTIYKSPMACTFYTFNTSNNKSNYGLRNIVRKDENEQQCIFYYVFNANSGITNENPIKIPTDYIGSFSLPYADKEGHYWQAYGYNQKNWLVEIIPEENRMAKPIYICDVNEDTTNDVYNVVMVTDKFILFNEGIGDPLSYTYMYNFEDNSIEKINLPYSQEYEKFVTFFTGDEINDEYYLIPINFESEWIYKFNYDTKSFEIETELPMYYVNSIYVRDNNFILLDVPWTGFNIGKYNVDTKQWSIKSFLIDEIIKN